MALLNYVANLSALESKEKNFDGTNPNDHRLIFSGDRHIYTHGVDFLLDYVNGNRGLVPSLARYTITNSDNLEITINPDNNWVLRKEGWGKFLDDDDISINTVWSSGKTNSIIEELNRLFVEYKTENNTTINNLLSSLDAMVFKGILDYSLEGENVTYNKLVDVPTLGYSAGWVYRVAKAGKYINDSVYCEEFDIIMAIADVGDNQNAINPEHWTVILNNISGTHNLNINGGSIQIASNTIGSTIFYAPNNPGTSGLFLVSTGTTPIWFSPTTLNVGSSDRVNHNLKLGAGLSYSVLTNDFYNGSEERTINLLKTTTDTFGGIKIGYDDSDTTVGVATGWRPSQLGGGNYAVTVDNNGKAYVNVPWIDTIRDIKIDGTSIGNKALNIIPSSEIYLSGDDSSTTDTYELSLGLLWYNIGEKKYEPGVIKSTTE